MKTFEDLRSSSLHLLENLEALCDKIEQRESEIQAFVPGTFERNRILGEGRALLERYPEPAQRPPLFGVPLGVKDIFRVDGFETRCGSDLPAALFKGKEASSVTRLRRAGAIIMGKTVTTEFAGPEPGPTRNPHNLAHTPGGSSSGSAAGVACGFFPVAFGTQTLGSITRPAAYCGVLGMKPSYGRVPIDGVILFSESADHVGLFFSDSSFIGPVMGVLIGDWQPVNNQEAPIVLGIPEGPYLYQASESALTIFEIYLRKLEQGGVTIKRIPALENVEEINENHRRLVTGEVTRIHAEWYSRYADRYRPRTAKYFIEGRDISDSELPNLRAQRITFREELLDKMEKEGLDGWICPSATNHAPEGLSSTGDPIMNVPWTNSGLPTISLPSGLDEFGLPHGLQLVGKFGQDEHLVDMAMQV